MRCVLGIDGGGTKTEAVVVNEAGRILGTGRSGPANYDDVGVATAQRHVGEAVAAARAAAGLDAGPFAAAFLGLAGVVSATDRAAFHGIARALDLAPPGAVGVDHDCRIALAGGVLGAPGIVLIAGTGSSCYGRTADGADWRAGGWGPLISDEGSSYWLGVQALVAAVRAYDGRGDATLLLDRFLRHLALDDINDLMRRLYVTGMDRPALAALAPLVVAAAQEGDRVAAGLLNEGATLLADCVAAVARRLGFLDRPCPVVLVGGLFQAGDAVRQPLRRSVLARMPLARVQSPVLSPVLGAALLALQAIGVVVEGAVERALRSTGTWRTLPPSS